MSMKEAKRFIEETAKDGSLMEQVRAIGTEAGENSASFYARAAKEKGFDFTAEELT